MAIASSSVYAKGALVGSDKDWFHGGLSTAQAEDDLTVSSCDCFLVRVSQGALILSLLHHGQVHHINIHYGPGWYELESGSAQYSFTDLEELVSHYRETAISDSLNIKLGAVCKKRGSREDFISDYKTIPDLPHQYEIVSDLPYSYETIPETTPHHYDYISNDIYSKGEPEGLAKYKWYHGKITRDEADAKLSIGGGKRFFVWHSDDKLMLSKKTYNSRIVHTAIHYSPKGYQLEGDSKLFYTIPAIVAYYQQSLGQPVETVLSDMNLKPNTNGNIFKKEMKVVQVNWKRCADLPVAFSSPHVVKIGDDVYAGGGMADVNTVLDDCVFKYNFHQDIWTSLPPCETFNRGLTTLNSELIAIGGVSESGIATNAVRTFRDGEWKAVLPPMPTPRWNLSTVSHDNKMIIAAGGTTLRNSNGEKVRTDTIEIYITDQHAWFSTKCLPFPLAAFKMCVADNTCYTLGGTGTFDKVNTTLYTTVSSLLEHALPVDSKYFTPQVQATWEQFRENHPLIFSSPVELDGRFFAIGGSAELILRCGTRFISTYDFATDTWVKCKGADLPVPLYRPGVLKLDHNRVMIVGGQPKMQQFSAAVYIGNYSITECNTLFASACNKLGKLNTLV